MRRAFALAGWYAVHVALLAAVFRAARIDAIGWLGIALPRFADLLAPIAASVVLALLFGAIAAAFHWLLRRSALEKVHAGTWSVAGWSLRRFFSSGLVLVAALFAWMYRELNDGRLMLAALFALIIWVAIGVFERRFLAGERLAWWAARPPRAATLLAALSVVLLGAVISTGSGYLFERLVEPVWLRPVLGELTSLVLAGVGGLGVALVVERVAWGRLAHFARARCSLRYFAGWALLEVRLYLIALWLLAPAATVAAIMYFVAPAVAGDPVLAAWAAHPAWRAFVRAADLVAREWFVALAPAAVVLYWLLIGRFHVLYDRQLAPSDVEG